MEIRQLRCLIAVAEHLNFTEAAKRLHVVQSVVSHHVAELEKELGARLFTRDSQSVHLTTAGKMLLKDAVRIVATADEAAKKIRDSATGVVGRLNIGFLATPVVTCLAEAFERFLRLYPNVFLDLDQIPPSQLSDLLESGDVDLGFTRRISVQNNPAFYWRTVYNDPISVIVPARHPMAGMTNIDIPSLANESFVFINRETGPGLFDLGLQLCMARGFMPKIVSQPNHMDTVLMMVGIGAGITILPGCYKSLAGPKLRFIDVAGEGEDVSIDLVVAWSKRNLNPSIPLFLRELGITG